ncbi:hypothetical protein HEP73_03893 [Xanthomonas sp. GW]|uniref:hypothetical protein n=1 Tax=Xanthomonas sp. GW TaxID=2724121 RepID=UPI00163B1B16|nr:hypothetical protein [Xanthomonas sp. GW]QNH22944.1 hypothetical protein HEP73_03893 [Xanthomonas sp. GW]
MGDWNTQPWANDEAADWFQRFWKAHDISLLIDEINGFDPSQERYDSIRAASYLLQTLGIAYVWPSRYLEDLKPLLESAIEILSNMLDPPDATWGFIDMWGDNPQVMEAVQEQIAALKVRLGDLVA